MSAFDHLLGQGFDLLVDKTDAPTISKGGVTAKCVCTPIGESKALRETGYWPQFHAVAEVKMADFVALKIVDRSIVTYRDQLRPCGIKLKVIGIEGDGADACVKITLKEEPAKTRAA